MRRYFAAQSLWAAILAGVLSTGCSASDIGPCPFKIVTPDAGTATLPMDGSVTSGPVCNDLCGVNYWLCALRTDGSVKCISMCG